MSLHNTVGDASNPTCPGIKVILLLCNDRRWEMGFPTKLSTKWPDVRSGYDKMPKIMGTFMKAMGALALITINPDLHVANLISKRGSIIPTWDLVAMQEGFKILANWIKKEGSTSQVGTSIHISKAKHSWPAIEALLRQEFVAKGVSVIVYE